MSQFADLETRELYARLGILAYNYERTEAGTQSRIGERYDLILTELVSRGCISEDLAHGLSL